MRHVSYLATLLVQGNSAVRPLGHDLFLLKLGLPRLHCHKHTIPPKNITASWNAHLRQA